MSWGKQVSNSAIISPDNWGVVLSVYNAAAVPMSLGFQQVVQGPLLVRSGIAGGTPKMF